MILLFGKPWQVFLDDFHRHKVWKIGDGRSTNFWFDKWSPDNESLISLGNQAYMDTTLFVRDVLTSSRDWDIVFLTNKLPVDIVIRIIVFTPPMDSYGS